MRELKLRAWHIEDRFMFIPRRIDFPHFMIGDPAKWEVWYQYEDSDDSTPEHFPLEDISFYGDELELMQYTGLKDKNGKEIYEGDVIALDGGGELYNFSVEFEDGCFGIRTNGKDFAELKYYIDMSFVDAEIIGNIYENPELKEATG